MSVFHYKTTITHKSRRDVRYNLLPSVSQASLKVPQADFHILPKNANEIGLRAKGNITNLYTMNCCGKWSEVI